MIVGNPDMFAIGYSYINEWNIDRSFCNGILLLFINGKIFPDFAINSTLSREIWLLKNNLNNIPSDNNLYILDKYAAFSKIYNIIFGDDDTDNNLFDLTPDSLLHEGYYFFAVSNQKKIRLFISKLEYDKMQGKCLLNNIDVEEVIVEKKYIDNIIKKLDVDCI